MKVDQVFHYHPEKAQGVRTTSLFEPYQTLSQLGAYNYQSISAAQRVGLATRDQSQHRIKNIDDCASISFLIEASMQNQGDKFLQTFKPRILRWRFKRL